MDFGRVTTRESTANNSSSMGIGNSGSNNSSVGGGNAFSNLWDQHVMSQGSSSSSNVDRNNNSGGGNNGYSIWNMVRIWEQI